MYQFEKPKKKESCRSRWTGCRNVSFVIAYIVVPYLLKLFNCIFSAGVFSELWSKALIIPIYKKCNLNDADNYREISHTSVFSKIFTGILNKRLTSWTCRYTRNNNR